MQYERVLEIEPQHSQALAFLGMVYHLLDATDKAIVKYHEVGLLPASTTCNNDLTVVDQQALSVDPINGHVIELLNLALESDTAKWHVGKHSFPGGEEAFEKAMVVLKAKYSQYAARDAGPEGGSGDGDVSIESVKSRGNDEMSIG